MSRVDSQQPLMPSLVDRLTDPESGGTQWRRGYGVEQMIDAVRRDLEDLLNTRQPLVKIPGEFPNVQQSLINYGLPDFASIETATAMARQKIGRLIETLVARYEPRLKDVKAVMVDPVSENDHNIRFHIEGKLKVDPAPEVAFETVLELLTGHATVRPTEA